MGAVLDFYTIVLLWVAPALAFPLLRALPPRDADWWLAVFVLASWPGLVMFLCRYGRDWQRLASAKPRTDAASIDGDR